MFESRWVWQSCRVCEAHPLALNGVTNIHSPSWFVCHVQQRASIQKKKEEEEEDGGRRTKCCLDRDAELVCSSSLVRTRQTPACNTWLSLCVHKADHRWEGHSEWMSMLLLNSDTTSCSSFICIQTYVGMILTHKQSPLQVSQRPHPPSCHPDAAPHLSPTEFFF